MGLPPNFGDPWGSMIWHNPPGKEPGICKSNRNGTFMEYWWNMGDSNWNMDLSCGKSANPFPTFIKHPQKACGLWDNKKHLWDHTMGVLCRIGGKRLTKQWLGIFCWSLWNLSSLRCCFFNAQFDSSTEAPPEVARSRSPSTTPPCDVGSEGIPMGDEEIHRESMGKSMEYMEVLMGKSSIIYIYTDYMDYKGLYMGYMDFIWLVVEPTPLKNMNVNWKDYPIYYGKKRFLFQTTNQLWMFMIDLH